MLDSLSQKMQLLTLLELYPNNKGPGEQLTSTKDVVNIHEEGQR